MKKVKKDKDTEFFVQELYRTSEALHSLAMYVAEKNGSLVSSVVSFSILSELRRVYPKSVSILDMLKNPPYCPYSKKELDNVLSFFVDAGLLTISVVKTKGGRYIKAYKATMKDK